MPQVKPEISAADLIKSLDDVSDEQGRKTLLVAVQRHFRTWANDNCTVTGGNYTSRMARKFLQAFPHYRGAAFGKAA